MRFRILGPLELTGDPDPASAGPHTPGPPKLRTVLGTLVARADTVVSVETLIDELWPDGPPRTALTTLHVYVSQIRKALCAASPRQGHALLVTRRPGYLLRTTGDDVDATVFERLRAEGRAALAGDDLPRAAHLLRRAEELWRGPLLSGTPHGPVLRAVAARLTEARLEVSELRVAAELRLGRDREVLPDLVALTTEHPLREEFHAQLLTALHRTGRHAEALHAYARLRGLLAEELGTEPGPRLRALHQRLLAEEDAPAHPRGPRQDQPGPSRTRAPERPRHGRPEPSHPDRPDAFHPDRPDALHADRPDPLHASRPDPLHADRPGRHPHTGRPTRRTALPGGGDSGTTAYRLAHLPCLETPLVGRDEELDAVESLLRDSTPGAWTAVTGPAGSGKTALAVAAARRVADAFPGGVLYLDLRTASRRPLTTEEAARRLLGQAASATAPADTPLAPPAHPDPVTELRALTGRRRLLLVLDGAVSVAQVRPLLPSAPGSTALVTARRAVTGATGARQVPLGPLSRAAARRMLAAAGPGIADEVGELCGRLPLVLRAAALALAARPHWDGPTLSARLREEATRLDVLRVGELDVRQRLLEEYAELPADLRRAVRLLALPPGAFSPAVAAAVLDRAPGPAALLVDALADRRLLLPDAADRYVLPEPTRLLAAERLRAEEPADSVRAATARMCEAYATAAARPGGAPRTAEGTRGLARVLGMAHAAGLWPVVLRLAEALAAPLERSADWPVWATAHGLALDAARRHGDERATARLLCSLGDLAWQQRDDERAAEHYGQAAALAAAAGLLDERARALAGLAELRLERGESGHAAELLRAAPEPDGAVGRYEVQRVRALVALETAGAPAATGPLTECVALAAALGDRRREAHARRALHAAQGPPRAFEVRPGVWRLWPDRPVPA
ncbi:BTAD domain-containing putative transcriptional regulator [Streptomyces sp. NPDC040750]|uniref:AfsR/SARP family transcriptional regulator n=1 Tax=Streptomyces sp. NPDC040750 TaxID=3154491 RepID=UPI0033EEC52F